MVRSGGGPRGVYGCGYGWHPGVVRGGGGLGGGRVQEWLEVVGVQGWMGRWWWGSKG